MRAVLDTNILIDYLHGHPQAEAELARYQSPTISIVSWMEVMAGATPATEPEVRAFLQSFEVVPLDEKIAERAVQIRRTKRIKLPDAVIWATAQVQQCLLVSRNSRGFDPGEPGVRLPYSL